MNYSEIIEQLRKMMAICDFAHSDFPSKSCVSNGRERFLKGIGECVEVDQYGGEDQGSTWYSVKYFPDHDIYIRVDGYYSSYEGVDFFDGWESCKEVRPKEKVITVYE